MDGTGSSSGITFAFLNQLFYAIADGNIQPDLLVGHNNSVASWITHHQPDQRYMKQSELDAGFLTSSFNGRSFVADLHVSDDGTTTEASNRVYMINTDFLDYVTHSDENNRLEPFAKPVDQAVGVAHVMWAGELTVCDRSRHGAFENFDSVKIET